jgi:hydrogenase nickel incorporation protein HypA/HybF
MHELSLAQTVVEIAEEAAKREGAERIEAIALRVGALAGVVPEALEFAFEVAKRGTLADNARLEVRYLPLVCYCARCGLEFEVEDDHAVALCPFCDELSDDIRQGQELDVAYVEVV